MEAVTLDRETHTYSVNLLSVTEILKENGFIDERYYTEEGKQRGSAVHLACEYYDQGDLDMDSVDPQIIGYVQAYISFKEQLDYEPEWIEIPQVDPEGKYVGTPDRIIITRPRSLDDIKSGPYQEWHRLQAAAYVNMLEDPYSYGRRGIYLKSNGKFSIKEFPKSEYMDDLTAFFSCLNICNWKRRH